MSLKIALPFSLLAFGGAATSTVGVYAHTQGSGKVKELGKNQTPESPDKPDPQKPENKDQMLTEPAGRTDSQASLQDPQKEHVAEDGQKLDNPTTGSGEGEQKQTPVNAPGGDAGSSRVPKDNKQQTTGQEDSVPKPDGSPQSGDKGSEDSDPLKPSANREQDQNQKNGSSGANPGNGESGTPTLEQAGKEGVENPSTQGAEDQVEGSVDTNKPGEEDSAGGKSEAGEVQGEKVGDKGARQEADTSGGPTEGTPALPEDTTRTSEGPAS